MQLSCNTPASLWDEFCATSAYLTNFIASSSIDGKTLYKLWFDRKPSLSHLRKVRCRAFALIQTHNPKLFQRSTPCVLIGYAPNAKAYHLWDTTTGWIFNSYHVTFIEHLQSQPTDLLPGTTINLNPDAPPSWDSTPVLSFVPPSCALDPDDDDDIPDPVLPSFPLIIAGCVPSLSQQPCLTMSQNQNQTLSLPSTNHSTIPQITIQPNNNNATNSTIPTITNNMNNTTNPTIPTITITPPQNEDNHTSTITPAIPPPLHCSSHLLAHQTNATDEIHFAFLSEFLLLCDTHDLFPLNFTPSNFVSTENFLSSLSDGSVEPIFDTGDDPSWSSAIRSLECEYWIARAHEELRNLADLQVFVLIPRSDVPHGR